VRWAGLGSTRLGSLGTKRLAQLRSRRVAERHRRAGLGFDPRRRRFRARQRRAADHCALVRKGAPTLNNWSSGEG
jgi:hypothetical protein